MRCFDDISLLTQEGSRELDLLYFLIKHPGASLKFGLKERCLMKRRCLSRVSSQLANGPTRRRIKSVRDVGELVLNPIQLIRKVEK